MNIVLICMVVRMKMRLDDKKNTSMEKYGRDSIYHWAGNETEHVCVPACVCVHIYENKYMILGY